MLTVVLDAPARPRHDGRPPVCTGVAIAQPHPPAGQVTRILPLGATLAGARTTALLKAEQLEVVRVVLAAGATMSQYTSIAFASRCKEMGVRPSMETMGDACDNAMAESLFTSPTAGPRGVKPKRALGR